MSVAQMPLQSPKVASDVELTAVTSTSNMRRRPNANTRPQSAIAHARDYARYQLDLALEHPLSSVALFLLSVAINVLLGGILMRALNAAESPATAPSDEELDDNASYSWSTAFFNAGHITADPGGLFDKIRASKGAEAFAACIVTLGGMVIFAVLIGGVSEVIAEKHRQLKRGRSRIMESGHFVILNWNDKIGAIITQIAAAQDRAEQYTVVVVNGDTSMEKESMDDQLNELNEQLEKPLKLIVTRTASPHDPAALRGINIAEAKAIIVLSAASDAVSDASTLRTLLCVLATMPPIIDASQPLPGQVASVLPKSNVSIVVEVVAEDNIDLLHGLDPRVTCVAPRQLLARLLVQTSSSHAGLSAVYQDLLSFDGSEFHLREWPQLVGQSFDSLQAKFTDNCTVAGVLRPSEKPVYQSLLNPANDFVMAEGDQLVVLAEGADAFSLRAEAAGASGGADTQGAETRLVVDGDGDSSSSSPVLSLPAWADDSHLRSKRILVVGWREGIDTMMSDLNEYVAAGSEVTILHPTPIKDRESRYAPLGTEKLSNIELDHVQSATDTHAVLHAYLFGAASRRRPFDSVMILSDAPAVATLDQAKEADSKILMVTVAIDSLMRRRHEAHATAPADGEKNDENKKDAADNGAAASSSSSSPPAALVSSSAGSSGGAAPPARVRVVSELSDVHTRSLIHAYDPSVGEFVVSGEIVAMAMVQMAYQPSAKLLWDELFTPDGSEIYLKDTRRYVACGTPVSFATLYKLARQRGEVLIGYLHQRHPPAVAAAMQLLGDVDAADAQPLPVLNPSNKNVANIVFAQGDVLVVIADMH